ncbi:MAG: nitroreductase family protein [Bacteroidota bacterium]
MERASCRNFTDDKIPPDLLRQVLAAGIQAPRPSEHRQPRVAQTLEKSQRFVTVHLAKAE